MEQFGISKEVLAHVDAMVKLLSPQFWIRSKSAVTMRRIIAVVQIELAFKKTNCNVSLSKRDVIIIFFNIKLC